MQCLFRFQYLINVDLKKYMLWQMCKVEVLVITCCLIVLCYSICTPRIHASSITTTNQYPLTSETEMKGVLDMLKL
jgi:hypothetical protein